MPENDEVTVTRINTQILGQKADKIEEWKEESGDTWAEFIYNCAEEVYDDE